MRLRRLLKRLAIVLVVLLVVGVAVFSWLVYWPLEGKVATLEGLVPADVDFVYKATWEDVRSTGWVDRNVLDAPVHPSLDVRGQVRDGLRSLREQFDQINASIPVAAFRLDLERDFLGGPAVVAGRWCGGTSPKDGPPRWREILAIVRMSTVARVDIALLRQGFVRSRAGPQAVIENLGDYLKITARDVPVSDEKARAGCEGGYVRPPENVWFLGRVKDALVLTNSEDLASKAVALGRGNGERAIDRPGFELKPTAGGVSAVIDVVPLRSYLNRALSGPEAGAYAAFLGRFTTIDALDRMNATLAPQGPDGLQAFADVRFIPSDLHPKVGETYRLPPRSFAESFVRLVPAKDTVAVAQVETPPRNLLDAVFDLVPPDGRRLWESNVREIAAKRVAAGQKGYTGVAEFFDELAQRIETPTGIAVARLSNVFDRVQYADWFSPDDPPPGAAAALFVRVKGELGSTPEERRKSVDEFLSDRAALLGFAPPVPAERDGVPYSRLELQVKVRDLEHLKPAYVVFEDQLVIATHEDYLFSIIATMRGGPEAPPSVAASDSFRASVSPLPQEVTIAVWVNADEARRLLWDYRNKTVHERHSDDAHAKATLARLRSQHGGGARQLPPEVQEKIYEEVDREVDRFRREEYAGFVAEVREGLDAWSRFRAASFAISAGRDDMLRAGAVLLLHPPGAAP